MIAILGTAMALSTCLPTTVPPTATRILTPVELEPVKAIHRSALRRVESGSELRGQNAERALPGPSAAQMEQAVRQMRANQAGQAAHRVPLRKPTEAELARVFRIAVPITHTGLTIDNKPALRTAPTSEAGRSPNKTVRVSLACASTANDLATVARIAGLTKGADK